MGHKTLEGPSLQAHKINKETVISALELLSVTSIGFVLKDFPLDYSTLMLISERNCHLDFLLQAPVTSAGLVVAV